MLISVKSVFQRMDDVFEFISEMNILKSTTMCLNAWYLSRYLIGRIVDVGISQDLLDGFFSLHDEKRNILNRRSQRTYT